MNLLHVTFKLPNRSYHSSRTHITSESPYLTFQALLIYRHSFFQQQRLITPINFHVFPSHLPHTSLILLIHVRLTSTTLSCSYHNLQLLSMSVTISCSLFPLLGYQWGHSFAPVCQIPLDFKCKFLEISRAVYPSL